MSMRDFISGRSSIGSVNAGLLILRIIVGLSLFLKHGFEKLTGYSTMVQGFPNPIHIGSHASLAFALFTDGICSLLVVFGLMTRPAAALILINLLTAFIFIHHAEFFGGPSTDHVQLVVLYIAAAATLVCTGAGKFSVDGRFTRV
jgi:putative oxidoreductase